MECTSNARDVYVYVVDVYVCVYVCVYHRGPHDERS